MILVDSQIARKIGYMFDISKSDGVTAENLLAQINPNSIDLTIAKEYKRPNAINNPVMYGFSSQTEQKLYDLSYWKDVQADDGYIVMKPGDTILGVTREFVTMPNDVCGQLFAKSTLGRMFINHMMAGVVDAGFCGKLTLELHNPGVHTVRIPVGARVVQMICYGLQTTPDRPYGTASRKSRYMDAKTVECAKWSENR